MLNNIIKEISKNIYAKINLSRASKKGRKSPAIVNVENILAGKVYKTPEKTLQRPINQSEPMVSIYFINFLSENLQSGYSEPSMVITDIGRLWWWTVPDQRTFATCKKTWNTTRNPFSVCIAYIINARGHELLAQVTAAFAIHVSCVLHHSCSEWGFIVVELKIGSDLEL